MFLNEIKLGLSVVNQKRVIPFMCAPYQQRLSLCSYWPTIDDALRSAAYDRGVRVRVLGSNWTHTEPDMPKFFRSLSAMNGTGNFKGVIEVVRYRLFVCCFIGCCKQTKHKAKHCAFIYNKSLSFHTQTQTRAEALFGSKTSYEGHTVHKSQPQ